METTTVNTKLPYTFRPGSDKSVSDFMEALLTQYNGNRNQAVLHCVKIAMGSPVPDNAILYEQLEEHKKKLIVQNKDMEILLKEVERLKSSNQKPVSSSGYAPDEVRTKEIAHVQKSRKLGSIAQAIDFCIHYTFKNAWL